MIYERCQRCEINYKLAGEQYCEVCRRELRGEWSDDYDEPIICPCCGIRSIEAGEEMCRFCRCENKRSGVLES